jgi:hypothetical protein
MPEQPATQREIVLSAMKRRPEDLWPRATGHVLLGVPGSPRNQKAYHEPGGSFSPSPRSFGVSFWIVHPDGHPIATSDTIPLDQITQQYSWADAGSVPGLTTQTPYYECRWSQASYDRWQCEVTRSAIPGNHLDVLIRSVGPAGGPVESLRVDDGQLIINHRWVVSCTPGPAAVFLGEEEHAGWKTALDSATSLDSENGWGHARIRIPADERFTLTVRDTAPQFASPLAFSGARSALTLDLPDKTFTASLEAQAANLMMGFVGRQTCPGEPMNYPLAWERDGAYAVGAMARCGQLGTARDLAAYFAENDFFGGFGAEADAPGSAINAIVSVAQITGDADFKKWIWPHVQRKAHLISEMLAARETTRKPWVGPIVPSHRNKECIPIVCQPAADGLITGSMDLHYPVLYVNAISYRGLRQAAALAADLGESGQAACFLDTAEKIRSAWIASFSNSNYSNERTYMSGLWPTWIIGPDFAPYRHGLRQRWDGEHNQGTYPARPLWTYFTVAEAHQWLFLDEPEVVWETLRYFWANQCSPGLFTYWEGNGEENAFRLWEDIRGWVAPPHVTPHYWTAAEVLLLQIDMLAYVAESPGEPVVVVGGGVPAEWLDQPMEVRGLPTAAGVIDWSYKDRVLNVTVHSSKRIPVRPGSNFAKEVMFQVRYA